MVTKKTQSIRLMFRGMESDKKAKEYIEKKLQKINRVEKNILEFEVEVDLDKKGFYRVELMAKTAHAMYRAEETSQSIEASMDIASDELSMQVVKDKNKMTDLKRRGARSLKKELVLDENAKINK